ncbi:MAG: precorrin-8X methylmutase [Alphaproteobacteria bacterium]|nr:MAG: precorrin-8X methylmutase [Alphaproteobacteria bacterium]
MVDWSAAGVPRRGADSIWIGCARAGEAGVALENPATRAEAVARLAAIFREEIAAGRRVLAGFDFPFGYPAGTAMRLAGGDWQALWALLAERVADGPDNANDRFDAAAALNARFGPGEGPFWGNGLKRDIAGLPRRRPDGYGTRLPARNRLADARARGAQEVWKLSGAGSVGGQALTGIAALERLRRAPELAGKLAVWPFETGLQAPPAPVVLAEIYPSLIPPDPGEAVRDAGQVRAVAGTLRRLDAAGELAALFAGPADLTPQDRAVIEQEEAWILGLGHEDKLREAAVHGGPAGPARPRRRLRYLRDPQAIYAESFATVAREARLDRFPPGLDRMAARIVHACGMVEVADRLAFSPDAWAAGRAALEAGAPIICDCRMLAAGIIARTLPAGNRVIETLSAPETAGTAARLATTRSAAAVELWKPHLDGAVVAIGNAPTALFHLLERLDEGWPRPALILGFPVGFVGAAQAKAELARDPRGSAYLALRGRRGGSAMAAAAVNALAAG